MRIDRPNEWSIHVLVEHILSPCLFGLRWFLQVLGFYVIKVTQQKYISKES